MHIMKPEAQVPTKSITQIALITAVCLLADSMLYVVLPLYWREAGLSSLYEVGILLSVNRFIRLPLNPLVSWIYKKMNIATGMMIAVMLTGIVTFLYAEASGFWFWLVLRCVWGMIWTFLRLGAFYAILNLSEPHNRGYLMGKYNGLSRLGSLVGMLAGGGLVWLFGMQAIFRVFAVLTLAALLLAAKVKTADALQGRGTSSARPPTGVGTAAAGKLWAPFLEKPVWLAMLTGVVMAYLFQGVFTSTLSHILDLQLADSGIEGTFLLNAAMLAGIFQAVRWMWEPWLAPWIGRKSDRPGRRVPLLLLTLGLAACLFGLIPLSMPLIPWLAVILCVQAAATVLTTLSDTIATGISAKYEQKAMIITVYSMMVDLGSAVGPMIAYSFTVEALYFSAAAGIAGLAVIWLVSRRQMVHWS